MLEVNLDNLESNRVELDYINKKIKQEYLRLLDLKQYMKKQHLDYELIHSIDVQIENLSSQIHISEQISEALRKIIYSYKNTEDNLVDRIEVFGEMENLFIYSRYRNFEFLTDLLKDIIIE